MKTRNQFHWLVAFGLSLFVFNGEAGPEPKGKSVCPVGYKLDFPNVSGALNAICTVDTKEMSKREYNKEGRGIPAPAANAPSRPAPVAKKTEVSCPAGQKNGIYGCEQDVKFQGTAPGKYVQDDDSNDGEGTETGAETDTTTGSAANTVEVDPANNGQAPSNVNTDTPTSSHDELVGPPVPNPKANTTPDDQAGGSCFAEYRQAAAICLSKANEAQDNCNEENQTIQAASSAAKAVGAGSVASMQLACSKLGQISKIANVGFGAWESACAMSQSNCETSCSDALARFQTAGCIPTDEIETVKAEIGKIRANISSCVAYKKKINEAAQHGMAALAQMKAAEKCQEDTSNELLSNNFNECAKNPMNPLCTDAQRCSNAEYASKNTVCKCINTPGLQECIAKNGANAGGRAVAGGASTGAGGANKGVDPGSLTVGNTPPVGAQDAFSNSLRDNSVKSDGANLSGQKGSASLGSSSGPAGGAGPASAGGSSDDADSIDKTKVNSGVYGGPQNVSGNFGKGVGATSGGIERPNAGGVNYNKIGDAQFDPRRYIAGLDGKREIINGPGIDIFEIVKNRIEFKKPTMLDPEFKK